MRRAPRISEKSVESEIRTLLQLNGWRVHKIDVMRGVTVEYGSGGRRRFTEGDPGQPDLIAVRGEGRAMYIECKAPSGKLEPHQAAYHRQLRKEGYAVLVPRSWDQLVEQADLAGIKVERS